MNEVRSFFERWQRVEEAKREASDDAKELRDEMKSCGFDAKVLVAVFRDIEKEQDDPAKAQEVGALYDLYRAQIDGNGIEHLRAGAREGGGAVAGYGE